ncbi:hypothetical protein [Mycoplasma sp. CSL7503-lung]|uniref:hypothetical protein n=1 Tax=Mycoplasma sp. CSL7503-lung TaxID=536372 RepID=UPI0021D2F099|nr:hypothetical protein [Mycoplasma sp. CSL7503-lung]MCU4706582.1 hypothetical protein [Mycoplasma sp. CSL7503-lung]
MKFKTKWFKGLVLVLPFAAAAITVGTVLGLKNNEESPEKVAYIKVINEATEFLNSTPDQGFSNIKEKLKSKVEEAKKIIQLDNKTLEELKNETQKLIASFNEAKDNKEKVLVSNARKQLKSKLDEIKKYLDSLDDTKYPTIKQELQNKYNESDKIQKQDNHPKETYRNETRNIENALNKAKSDVRTKDEEIRIEEENKKAIQSLKEEITQIKSKINEQNNNLNDRYKTQKDKVSAKLLTFNNDDTQTRNQLEATKTKIISFESEFNNFERDTKILDEVINSHQELRNVNNDEISKKLTELNEVAIKNLEKVKDSKFIKSNDENKSKNTFFNWELGANNSTFEKNTDKDRYTNFLTTEINEEEKESIKNKLLDTTGLKNMFAVLLGYEENYNDLFINNSYIIDKNNLNNKNYDNFKHFEGNDNGKIGLHPRLLENWLIFNWDKDQNNTHYGDTVDKINDKVEQLFTELEKIDNVETFKENEFTELSKRINDFSPLIKNAMTDDKRAKAKEYSEAYLSSYLNLAIIKYEMKKYIAKEIEKVNKSISVVEKINNFLEDSNK